MDDHQRQVVLLAIGAITLAAHLMIAAEFAMVGGEHDDRVLVHAVGFERVQHANDLLVAVADAVVVIVAQQPPAAIFVRPRADEDVLHLLIDLLPARAARRVERLAAGRRQWHVVPRGACRSRRPGGRAIGIAFVLPWTVSLRQVRIDVHYIVRVDEIDGEIPGPAGRPERLALGAQPAGTKAVVVSS